MLVAALSTHRANAFEAVEVLMDYLKTDAPLWKKESGPQGARWIEPRAEDHARRAKAEKGMTMSDTHRPAAVSWTWPWRFARCASRC